MHALRAPTRPALPLGGTLGGGGLLPLPSQGAQRPRRLGQKGEGVTLSAKTPPVTPSPCLSKFAALTKRNSPPPPRGHQGGGARIADWFDFARGVARRDEQSS